MEKYNSIFKEQKKSLKESLLVKGPAFVRRLNDYFLEMNLKNTPLDSESLGYHIGLVLSTDFNISNTEIAGFIAGLKDSMDLPKDQMIF